MLNGKLADSSLQVGQLKAEMAVRLSKGQHDAGNSQTADMGTKDLRDHDMQLQHADLASTVDILKAKASNHAYHVSKLVKRLLWRLPASVRR